MRAKFADSQQACQSEGAVVFGDPCMVEELFANQLANPEVVLEFRTYRYEHVDMLDFMPFAADVLHGLEGAAGLLRAVADVLSQAGWEGDGDLRVLWMPPFAVGQDDGWGVPVWFVKQSNNGTAFLASPIALCFKEILDQQR